MNSKREDIKQPAFTVSIDAKDGVTTGGSASDRAATIQTAISDSVSLEALRSPGHIFPLRAADGGFAERKGHTESSLEIVKRASLKPAAVICEILNDDGNVARLSDVEEISRNTKIPLVRISDLLSSKELQETK